MWFVTQIFCLFFSEHNKAQDNSLPHPPRQTELICLHWLRSIPACQPSPLPWAVPPMLGGLPGGCGAWPIGDRQAGCQEGGFPGVLVTGACWGWEYWSASPSSWRGIPYGPRWEKVGRHHPQMPPLREPPPKAVLGLTAPTSHTHTWVRGLDPWALGHLPAFLPEHCPPSPIPNPR